MTKRIMAAAITLASLFAGYSFASTTPSSVTPDEALQRLMDGNKRYVQNHLTLQQRSNTESRTALAKSQKPYAVVLTCSDSRVPPELLFDQGLGEIFVIRVAGNIPDPIVIGSIEYAVEHLGSSLVMVLGHERCGAVKAAVESKGKGHGNIGAIIKKIAPAIKSASKSCNLCNDGKQKTDDRKDAFVECVVDANAGIVKANLTKKSKVLKRYADRKKIRIVSAKYDLDDGQVSMLK